MYMQPGQHQLAFEQLGTAMAFDPNYTRAIMAAGSMMQSHQDFDVALVNFMVLDCCIFPKSLHLCIGEMKFECNLGSKIKN